MPEFRRVANGYINNSLEDKEIGELFTQLKYINKQMTSDFEYALKGFGAVETIPVIRKLVGTSFKEFIEANYNSGHSTLSHLVRNIVSYLNGVAGYQNVTTLISVEKARFDYDDEDETYNNINYVTGSLYKDGESLTDFDLYRLIAGIGLGQAVKFFLLLGGKSFNV